MSGPCPKLSDDDLLALISQLGRDACAAEMRDALTARTRAEVSLGYVDQRIERLLRGGLVRLVFARTLRDRCVRLTAVGVERLQALQREPKGARTNGDETNG
jgi:hypothetical protein